MLNSKLYPIFRDNQCTPLRVNALRREEVKEVSVGLYHVVVATRADKVFAWGDCKFGRVGRPGVETEEVSVCMYVCLHV